MMQTLAAVEYLDFRQAATALGVAQPGGGPRETCGAARGIHATPRSATGDGWQIPEEVSAIFLEW